MNDDNHNNSIINRVPVPKPELDVAIQCIHDSISNYIDNYKRKHNITTASDNNDQELSNSLSTLKEEISTSLISSIESVVTPFNENEFRKRYIKFDTPMKEKISKLKHLNVDEMSCSSSSDDDDGEDGGEDRYLVEEEDDEEDFVDQVALQRAKELRALVRKKAMDVQQKKESKLSTILDFISKQLYEWEIMSNDSCSDGSDDRDGDRSMNENQMDEGDSNTSNQIKTENQKRLQQMSTSLSNLEATLQSMEGSLPDTLESIQQSIDTIQHYITKKEKESMNGPGVSNHIERAILSRIDANKVQSTQKQQHLQGAVKNNGNIDIMSRFKEMDAEQRFSLFVSQMGS